MAAGTYSERVIGLYIPIIFLKSESCFPLSNAHVISAIFPATATIDLPLPLFFSYNQLATWFSILKQLCSRRFPALTEQHPIPVPKDCSLLTFCDEQAQLNSVPMEQAHRKQHVFSICKLSDIFGVSLDWPCWDCLAATDCHDTVFHLIIFCQFSKLPFNRLDRFCHKGYALKHRFYWLCFKHTVVIRLKGVQTFLTPFFTLLLKLSCIPRFTISEWISSFCLTCARITRSLGFIRQRIFSVFLLHI